ncbi:hypothetical protein, partial [Synergistes jonesii]|uniref:hypothetical protein n=1 Tax=Synergistes jonesii TaxID=2754 RepID=UPI00248EC876
SSQGRPRFLRPFTRPPTAAEALDGGANRNIIPALPLEIFFQRRQCLFPITINPVIATMANTLRPALYYIGMVYADTPPDAKSDDNRRAARPCGAPSPHAHAAVCA